MAGTLRTNISNTSPAEAARLELLRNHGWVLLALVWVGLLLRFYHGHVLEFENGRTWGVNDDVYIAADFARTWAHGEGALWYPGAPRIEGFTSPIWVLILAAIHKLPWFVPSQLGLYVTAINVALVTLLAKMIWGAIQALPLSGTSENQIPTPWLLVLPVLGLFGGLSLCYWLAAGFEIGLVDVIAFAAFAETIRKNPRWIRIGVLIGLAFWTRMDAVLYCAAVLPMGAVTLLKGPRGPLVRGVLVSLFMFAILFATRYAYYGDWFPNTYYLKATGWPLAQRLPLGWMQNGYTISVLALGALGLVTLALGSKVLSRRTLWVLAALGTHLLAVSYSTFVGGDAWSQVFGYDRFGSAGSPLLLFGVGAAVMASGWRPRERLMLSLSAVALLALPAIQGPAWSSETFERFFSLREPALPRSIDGLFVRAGYLLGDVTRPGARIAVCGAGATVYFAERGGVDLLGKIDDYIAKMNVPLQAPPEARCWSPRAGHNKEDLAGLFALRRPDISIVEPPANMRAEYTAFRYGGPTFYALRDSPLVYWDKVDLVSDAH